MPLHWKSISFFYDAPQTLSDPDSYGLEKSVNLRIPVGHAGETLGAW